MATLKQIGTTGVGNVKPTPIQSYAVNQYLINNQLMNSLVFVNNSLGSNTGNFQTSYVYYTGTDPNVDFRVLGENYTADNAETHVETVALKMLGGSITVDHEIKRAFGSNSTGLANYTEQQFGQKINAIVNKYADVFINGNKTTNPKEFDGLLTLMRSSQVVSTAIPAAKLTNDIAINVEGKLNDVMSLCRPRPNVILTTPKGASFLRTLNANRNRGVEVVEVNSVKYDAYMGIPIVVLDGVTFGSIDNATKAPILFAYFGEYSDGIYVTIPADGQFITAIYPQFTGEVTQNGSVEVCSAVICPNPFSMALCTLDFTAELDLGE